nr:thioesterase family protein [Pantoea sp. A4]
MRGPWLWCRYYFSCKISAIRLFWSRIFVTGDVIIKTFRVSMRDIDLNGHVHNSVYLDYFEDAVVEQLRAFNLIPLFRPATAGVSYHVKKSEATYHLPLAVDDIVTPKVMLEKLGNSSLTFAIELQRNNETVICASGKLVWVCVDLDDHKPRPIPEATRQQLIACFQPDGA